MNIYTSIEPTRLYIKQCSHCELKYYGKHTGKNIEKYKGGGKYWKRHLKKHKAIAIHIWNSNWFYDTSIVDVATKFSTDNNIVESSNWANMKFENGLDGNSSNFASLLNKTRIENGTHNFLGGEIGGNNSRKRVADGTHPFVNSDKQRKNSEKSNRLRIENGTHNLQGPNSNIMRLENGTHPSQTKKICENCNKCISISMYARWHGNKCKMKKENILCL
jgi:hypothetical protein